jgi:hypothetical protein
VDLIDPGAGQVRQGLEVGLGRQPLRLKAPHLAAGSGQAIQPLSADDRTHGGITGESLGVVDVLVAGETPEHRLPKQSAQLMAHVPTASAIEELRDRDLREPEGIVEFAVGQQAAVRGDPRAVEFELDPAVERGPQRGLSAFTRLVPHDLTLCCEPISWSHYQNRAKVSPGMQLIRGIRA